MKGPVKEKHVALLPVRYAIAPRADGAAYRYTTPTLKQDLPPLAKASYVLRSLRRGFVYVYVEGQLLCLAVTAGGNLRPHGSMAGIDLLIDGAALLLPSRYGKAKLAYSEHEWTSQQCQRVTSNSDGARNALMQPFALLSPANDSLPLANLGNEVEEYAGRAGEYAWSDARSAARSSEVSARLKTLAEDGQHVVALADPIGISHDLAALVDRALGDIKQFVSNPDVPPDNAGSGNAVTPDGKTKQAAPLLQQPSASVSAGHDATRVRYRMKLVAETIGRLYESHLKPGADPDKLAKLRLEYWRNEPANRGKPEPSISDLRRQVVTTPSVSPGAARLIKHVDEVARQAFLSDYDKQLNVLRQVLEDCRSDRCVWLGTWNKRNEPHALHAAWHSFDMDDKVEWQHFELSCARSIAGLGMSDGDVGKSGDGVQARELELIGKWLQASLDDSPLYQSLIGHTPLRKKVEQSPAAHAPDRTGATADGVRSVMGEIYKLFPYTIGTEEVTRCLTVYLLTKPGKWRGGALDSLDQWIARMVGNEEAATVIRGLMGRHGQYVTTNKHPLGEYKRLFVEAAGDPPGLSQTLENLAKSGTLRGDGYTTFAVEESNVAKRNPVFGKGQPNPFRGWGTAGISAFVGLLYLVNLKMAVVNFNANERGESIVNLVSAFAAIGSGINASLMAFETATPRAVSSLYIKLPFARSLSGLYALRLFGYGGAFLTGATLGIHGTKLTNNGDYDAGLWYASSAIAATAGGTALTYASAALATGATPLLLTPVGWFIIGAVLVGGSIYLSMAGDEAVDTPLENWLDACTFGKHELPDSSSFASLSDEMDTLGGAMYAPQLIESDWADRWGFDHYLATATVYLPAYVLGKSHLAIRANGISMAPVKDRFENGGRFIDLQNYIKHDAGIKQANFEIEYRPSDAFKKPYALSFSVS